MSSDLLIDARGLGKCYSIYERPHHRLLELLGGKPRAREFWALRGVDLSLRRGESVGIVGRNGSGKSTLLQIVCGTLTPTEGEVEVRGRVAALLELGAGFNPEFTGLENVYLNASLMGLDRAEVDLHLPDILAFADIGHFVHQPVRTYSSGMFVRLAFSVAVAVMPDILVVDEALAVGDEAFQRKCHARIEQLRDGGTAILYVSHAATSVLQLCDRAILMDGGRKWLDGPPKPVVSRYQKLLYASTDRRDAMLTDFAAGADLEPEAAGVATIGPDDREDGERFDPALRPESTVDFESRGARIFEPRIETEAGRQVNVLVPGRVYHYRYRVAFDALAARVHFGMMIKSVSGLGLFGMASHAHGEALPAVDPGSELEVCFRFRADLLPGVYFLNAGCMGSGPQGEETYLHRLLDVLMFRVENPRSNRRVHGYADLAVEPACSITPGDR